MAKTCLSNRLVIDVQVYPSMTCMHDIYTWDILSIFSCKWSAIWIISFNFSKCLLRRVELHLPQLRNYFQIKNFCSLLFLFMSLISFLFSHSILFRMDWIGGLKSGIHKWGRGSWRTWIKIWYHRDQLITKGGGDMSVRWK